MNVLTLYIVREILKACFIASIVLLTFYNLFTFSDEIGDIGKGEYGLKQVLIYLALTTPRAFYQLLPSAALLGSLIVLGTMANKHELVAMRIATFSIFGLIKAVVIAGLILVLITTGISEFVVPITEKTAQVLKAHAQEKEVLLHTDYGFWLRDDRTYINVRQMPGDGKLADISLYEMDDKNNLTKITHAERARYIEAERWVMEGILETEIIGNKIVARKIDKAEWRSAMDPGFLDVVVVKPETLSLYDLYKYIQFLQDNGQKSQSFELAFWSRVADPIVIVVMLLVAVPFVIKVERQMSMGFKIMAGTLMGLSFHLFDKIIGHLGLVYGYDPMLMGFLPGMVILTVAVAVISTLR